MPEFYRFRPEARFGHYLMMIGAIGEGDCTPRAAATESMKTQLAPARFTTGSTGLRAASPDHAVRPKTPKSGNRRPVQICLQPAEQPATQGVPMPLRETRRILLDGNIVDVERRGDELVAGDGRTVDIAEAVHLRRWCRPRSSVCI